jgi:TP901 family phage tail tape measure protein
MKSFGTDLNRGLGRVAGIAAKGAGLIGAAVVGAGVAAFKMGQQFDDAYDTIRVGTGATGKALEALKDDFRGVVSSVPTDFESASTAVADLNTRLGLTGEPLQQMAGQVLELSRLTGTDLSSNIQSVSRVFGDWGVETENQSDTLDALFRASQSTGIGVDQLAGKLVQFGAPLRQMGFDFETSTALLSSFEREGVNAELVMGSMRIALGKFAREGVTDTNAALTDLIESIANAGSEGEATALSMEYFGARAGSDMAAAIREGRFSVEELVDVISNGGETIMQASEDTRSFTESWQQFKNNAMLALEPVVVRVFDTLSEKMDEFGGWWEDNGDDVIATVTAIKNAFVALWDAASTVSAELHALMEDVKVSYARATTSLEESSDRFTTSTSTSWSRFTTSLSDSWSRFTTSLSDSWNRFSTSMSGSWNRFTTSLSDSWGRFTTSISDSWNRLSSSLTESWARLSASLSESWNRLTTSLSESWNRLTSSVSDGMDRLVGWFQGLPGRITSALGDLRSLLAQKGRDLIEGFIGGITGKAKGIGSAIGGAVTGAWDKLASGGPVGDGAMPGSGSAVQRLSGFMRSTGIGHRVTSTFRPGDKGFHGLGRAVDFAGTRPGVNTPELRAIQRAFLPLAGSLKELIGPDPSMNFKNGRRFSYNSATQRAHQNHVHTALATGAFFDKPQFLVGENPSSAGEWVLPDEKLRAAVREEAGGADRGGSPLVIHVHGSVIHERELGDLVGRKLAEFNRRNGR